MNRRDMIVSSSAAVFAMAKTAESFAAEAEKSKLGSIENKYAKIIASTQACIDTGLACIKHCQKELAEGNKVMAECLQSVLELVSTCQNLHQLASYESSYTKDFAKLTAKVCADCAKICEKHKHHMLACKNCFEACNACEKACADFV